MKYQQKKVPLAYQSAAVICLIVVLITLVVFSPALAFGRSDAVNSNTWSRSGPVVGSVNAIVIAPSNPAIRYAGIDTNTGGFGAGSNRGVYKSSDGGVSWSKTGFTGKLVYSLAVDLGNPNVVYCGTSSNGLFKSTDGGANWNGPYLGNSASVFALLIDPNNASIIYASALGNGLYKSTDSGLTWSSISTGLQFYGIHALAIDPGNTNILYAAAGYGASFAIYKSINAGANWTSIGTGIPDSTDDVNTIVLSQSNTSILYAGKGSSVYKSTDAGAHWNVTGSGLPNSFVTSLAIDPLNPAIVLAGTISRGVFKSTDGGASWNSTALVRPGVNTLIFEAGNSNNVYAGTRGDGIAKSTDAGMSWSPGSNLPAADVHELTANFPQSLNLYANTADGVYSTTLTDWVSSRSGQLAVIAGTPTHKLVIDPNNPTVLYCASDFSGVHKTTNGGADWTQIYFANTNINTIAVDPGNSQNVYLATYPVHLFKSPNGGANWNAISAPGDVSALAIDPVNPEIVYAGTNFGVSKSTNGGASWVVTGLHNGYILSLVLAPGNSSTLYAAAADGHAYKSTDAGATWNTVFNDVTGNVLAFAFNPAVANTVFAGTDQGVFMSTNGGQSSGNFSNGLPAAAKPVMALAFEPPRILYAGTPDGVYTLDLGPTVNEPLSGRVADIRGVGISGVRLTVSGSPSGQTVTTLTDANGNYSFNNSVEGDTLTPSKAGFVFDPPNVRAVSSGGPIPITGTFNFIGGTTTDTLSGKAIDGTGASLSDVMVVLSGSMQRVVFTDANGNYALTGIFPGGNYTLTPSKQGYVFFPSPVGFTNLPSGDFTINTFVGTTHPINISGQVKDGANNPVSGVAVRLRRPGVETTTTFTMQTNGSGNYSFLNLAPEMSYVLTPVKTGFSFSPASATLNNSVGNQTVNFTATPLPTVQFSAGNFSVGNGDIKATITATRTGDLTVASTVDYATADGTASQQVHYTFSSGTLAFAPGEVSKQFSILITDGALTSYPATVNITLANAVGATLGTPATALLTINQNHSWPAGTNPADDAPFFVRQQYADFLNREPDQSGLNYWSGQITQCGTDQSCIRARRIDVSNAFFYELEYQQTGSYVYRLYRTAFGNNQPFPNPNADANYPGEEKKIPSYAVFVNDRARVVGGANLAQAQLDLATAFVLRPQFLSKYPPNLSGPAFVDALLASILNDLGVDLGSERQPLIDLFNASGRGAVLYRLADDNAQANPLNNRALIDAEYNRAFVATQYFGYLRRDPDMAGFLFWLRQVSTAPLRDVTRQHAMVCSFITSAEYQLRFSAVVTHSNAECQ